ncbi:hypothetical protein AB4Y44_41985, partial [Paraburkholderia sp. BR10937]|uniref:hypothetical protein n=1 Tax=Paraburkholderia sp. BR10937 TaxID=3236994 RepID=UPI0034D24812
VARKGKKSAQFSSMKGVSIKKPWTHPALFSAQDLCEEKLPLTTERPQDCAKEPLAKERARIL